MENLPLGFAFSLSMNKQAMDYYSTLDFDTQAQITRYIENATSTKETKNRINSSINALSHADTSFLFFL